MWRTNQKQKKEEQSVFAKKICNSKGEKRKRRGPPKERTSGTLTLIDNSLIKETLGGGVGVEVTGKTSNGERTNGGREPE